MIQEHLLTEEHIMFRNAVRKFFEREVAPYHEEWEKAGIVPRDIWLKAGANGFLCMDVPEEYGGMGVDDYRYLAIFNEEQSYTGCSGPGFSITNELVVPYLMAFGNEEQKKRWLPKLATGEYIGSLAMTEPNTGSDLQSIKTTAIRNGDHYVVNGSKTFISNGILSDVVVTYVKTTPDAGGSGTSMLVLERGMEGFERGRNLEKMGGHAQDTAELFFNNVKVPVENRLGEEGKGFSYLMHNLPQERLQIAGSSLAVAEAAFDQTLAYVKERTAFGRPIGKFQNSRFVLAEIATEIRIARVFIDNCMLLQMEKKLSAEEAAMAKWWLTDLAQKVLDRCVQLHGGYGYMLEYPVAKKFAGHRIMSILGGTNEIMKEIIGRRQLGL